jgi:hypothetical protein
MIFGNLGHLTLDLILNYREEYPIFTVRYDYGSSCNFRKQPYLAVVLLQELIEIGISHVGIDVRRARREK